MLRKLSIQNFILIDTLELDFAENFTSITGETGSGKSILLGALNLIKGDRADYNVIGPNGDKSIVEAHFDMPSDLTSIFEVLDLEIWEELILRREIQKNGKSRSFVNDTPVSLQQLKEISQHLMAIHSQYNTLELKEKNYQLFLLDVLAGTLDESTRYKVDFLSHKNMLKELAQLKTQLQIDSAKQDYESFVLAEIQGLDLEHTSYKSLEEKLNFQEKRQELLSVCTDLYAFTEHESTASLPVIKSHLEKLAVHDKELDFLIQYVDSLQSSLKEIAYLTTKKMEVYSESTGEDVQLLSRVDDFNRLLNKHRLQNEEELLLLKQTLENNRTGIDELSDRIVSLEATSQVMKQTLLRQATSLNEARTKALPRIHQDFAANLNALKLKDAKLTFQLVQHENLHENLVFAHE
jgi:DNA repair protein RecN (Recombination protein N)